MHSRNRQAALLTVGSMSLLLAGRAVVKKWREYSLRDRVVLIMGGSRGLGLVIARQMLRQGAKVAICARDGEELERASNDLGRDHRHVLSVPCDVTDREQVHAMVGIVQRHFGTIDVLINNAGIIQVGPVELMTHDDYAKAMNVHFWGPLYTVLAVLPAMRRRREGRIVNLASIGGKVSVPHLLPCNASKFALVWLSGGYGRS